MEDLNKYGSKRNIAEISKLSREKIKFELKKYDSPVNFKLL